jgi:probable aminopeptidase NPEPL1
VNNTDAEGRLVLADGVAYASRHLAPEVIVDLATLTGAALLATGRKHSAIITDDAELEVRAVAAGLRSGDLVHPLPYAPELYRAEFRSEVADMKNSVKDRMNAQTSCAAQFVGEHLDEDWEGSWLHVDMAGPVIAEDRGTGYGVALLVELFGLR